VSSPKSLSADAGPTVSGNCTHCQRVVAGFPGDFAKCESCKRMTTLPLEAPHGWRLIRDPNKLVVLPVYFVVLFYASILAIAWTGGGTDPVGGGVVVIVFAMWIYAIMQFSRTAERQRRWWTPVVLYHAASLLVPVCLYNIVRAASAIAGGTFTVGTVGRVFAGIAGLLVCFLLYGFARGRVARLRLVRDEARVSI